MRSVALAVLLAACASTAQPPTQLVAGCWANRTPPHASVMHWSAGEGAALQGELRDYSSPDSGARVRYSLSPAASGWQLCELGEGGETCWAVAQSAAGSLEGGRAFIDRYRDRLRVGIVGADGGDRVIFDGQREVCS